MTLMNPSFHLTMNTKNYMSEVTKLFLHFFIDSPDLQFIQELKNIIESNYQEVIL